MESITLKKFIEERITENQDLFTKKEWQLIMDNMDCFGKVYLLGVINSKDCYEKNDF